MECQNCRAKRRAAAVKPSVDEPGATKLQDDDGNVSLQSRHILAALLISALLASITARPDLLVPSHVF